MIGDQARRSPIERRAPTRLDRFAGAFWSAWERGARSTALDLARAEAGTMHAALARLDRLVNRRLADDCEPWIRRFHAWLDAFDAAVDALAAPTADRRTVAVAALDVAARGTARVDDRGFERWVRRALGAAASHE
jgi:hypothetical protein